MKTIIDEHGCTTHPHGGPSLEITVPVTVNGTNLTKQISQQSIGLLQLTLQVESLHSRIKELEAKLVELTATKETTAVVPSVAVTTEEPVVAAKPTSSSNGKKPQKVSQTVEA